jgi:hypothetical protein
VSSYKKLARRRGLGGGHFENLNYFLGAISRAGHKLPVIGHFSEFPNAENSYFDQGNVVRK